MADLEQRRERLKEIQLEWEALKKSAVGHPMQICSGDVHTR